MDTMDVHTETQEDRGVQAEAVTLRFLAVFFTVFGVILWMAPLFATIAYEGKVVNFLSGLALALAGMVCYFRARKVGHQLAMVTESQRNKK